MTPALRVLYAEDNAADADLTRRHFESYSPAMSLDVVGTARACLATLAEKPYDVLLLDNRLPDMDGVDLLKSLAGAGVSMPVVMVTSVGDEALAVQVLRLGASDYVPKNDDYIERLPAAVANAVAEHRDRSRYSPFRIGPRRVLYAEHDRADIDLTLRYFEEAAAYFTVEVVGSSAEVLTRLQSGGIELVVTDFRLPDMSALDLLRETKARHCQVPFVVITGMGDEEAAVAALKLGAFDYVVKRNNYLVQLPIVMENAIVRSDLQRSNARLEAEIVERERLAAENAELFADAQEALRSRDEFLSIAAHEIRGPLTSLRLGVQSLRQGRVPTPALPEIFKIIEREDRKLAQFVDELLDLGRIRAGTLLFTFEPVDIRDVINEVVARMTTELQQAGSTVEIDADGALDGDWDRSRLDQIASNLLSNAIKFGLGRPIEIALHGSDDQVRLRIRDNGAGITHEERKRIFEPFVRDMSPRNYGGLGLGLYIVRTIVDGFGGTLTVESEPGKGSAFTVELPRSRPLA